MADEIAELSPLQEPGEITVPEAGSKYESYKTDSVYEYALLPGGRRPDKSKAKITYKYGDVYDGGLKRGKFNGTGKYIWKGGDAFEGNFKSGKISGQGKFTAANGDVYEGNFKDNKYEGNGKYTWADGRVFEGTFKNGQVSSGRYVDENGNVYSCKFSYHANGERKSSTIRLVRFAEKNTLPTAKKKQETKSKTTNKDGLLSKDTKLIAAIKKSKRGAEFKNFYSGAAGKSEKAEKGLIAILNFFSNSDAVLKYTSVFNAEQCHNFPERNEDEFKMSETERANQNALIETIISNSAAPIVYGGVKASYLPDSDEIHLPAIEAFDSMQDYYATALHEIAHSTGHESRLNRDLTSGYGSESYAKEELRAELACVFMQMENGIQLEGKHIDNHAAYLNSWLEAAKKDTSVFFKAAADAQRIADYVAENYMQNVSAATELEEHGDAATEQAEINPMAEYLQTESEKRAEEIRTMEQLRTGNGDFEDESLKQNVKQWYISAYPNDEAGSDINEKINFAQLENVIFLKSPVEVYDVLGADSVVRERVFTKLSEIRNVSYDAIYSAWTDRIEDIKSLALARQEAKRLAKETGEPYVTIEWAEKANGFPDIEAYDVMSLSEADKKLKMLDAQAANIEGYFKTRLHIDYVFEGNPDSYENCRFDIGSENGGLVHHIDSYLKNEFFFTAEDRAEADALRKYFKVHADLSAMVDTAIASKLSEQEQYDVQSYVLAARNAVNSAVPFSTYKLPDMSAFEQEESTAVPEFFNQTRYGSAVSGIIETENGHHVAIINNTQQKEIAFPDGYPAGYIIAHDYNPNTGEFLTATQGFASHEEAREYLNKEYGFDIGQSREGGDHKAKIGLTEKRLREYADILRRNDLEVGNTAQTDEYYLKQAREQIAAYEQSDEYQQAIREDFPNDFEGEVTEALLDDIEEGDHEEKLTVEDARNAMLDAHNKEIYHYAIVIENMPYTNPEDGYESEEPAQNVYVISDNGRVQLWTTLPVDGYLFTDQLPYGRHRSYEQIEIEELEEIAANMRKPMQAYMDALRAENERAYPDRHRPEMYYEDRAMDVLEEHYIGGVFQRELESPKYLSGTKYAEEDFRGDKVLSIVKFAQNRNIAILASRDGKYVVEDDYHTDDGRNWGRRFLFDDQKTAEEFVNKAYDKGEAQSINLSSYDSFSASTSEMVRRYAQVKRENPAEIVFYRIGDFYEVLGEDARRVAQELELTLTGRDAGLTERIPMAGVPYHAIDEYAAKLAEKGVDVAIADGADLKHIKGNSPRNMPQTTQNTIQNTFCTDFGGEYKYFVVENGLTIEELCKRFAKDGYSSFGYSVGGRAITYEQYKEIRKSSKGFHINFLDDLNAYSITQDGKEIESGYLDVLALKYQEQGSQNELVQANTGKREWLTIDLPDGVVGGRYGENTMIKMPKGEFSYYAFYVSSKMLRETDGKTQLRVASDYTFRLNNDGRQVELTGKELADSFNGVHLDKTYKRVAPSRRYAKTLENLEKNVPSELKAIPTWCCYRTHWNAEKGKKEKFLISAIDGKWASSKEPGRWVTFDAAMKYARENNCEGVSMLLDKKYGITCIDLDKCILNAETGEMNERATKLVAALGGTYIERSTSGNGLHIFVKDDILKNGQYNVQSVDKTKGDLEVYDDKRIMSLTGDMYSKGNALTRAGSAATVYLRQELGERRNVSSSGSAPRPATGTSNLSDSELIRWIRSSKQGSKFDDLYSGRGVSGDRSNDDGKLAHMLLYFNGGDKEQAFRIIRESGAYRSDKPDEYYRHTIDKMNDKIEVYAKRPTLSAGGANKPKGKGKPGNQA